MIEGFFIAGFVLATAAMLVVAGTTLAWMIDSWRTPRAVGQMPFPEPDAPQLSFSLIVPARHEEAVLADTVRRLLCQDHPFVEVLVVVGDDDPGTAAVAYELAEQDPRVVVIVDDSVPKNKPKALNRALAHCTGEITGVFDAEDEVAPRRVHPAIRTVSAMPHISADSAKLSTSTTTMLVRIALPTATPTPTGPPRALYP